MNLGKILEAAQSGPSVTCPVKFRVGGVNLKLQKTAAASEAVLVYVGEDERAQALVEAASYLAKKFPGTPIPAQVQESEETIRFMAVALRDKGDGVSPFCDADQLRSSLPLATLADLSARYRTFIDAEYPVEPSAEDEQKLKEQAAGK